MSCTNKTDSIESQSILFFLLGRIYCFTSDELRDVPKTGNGSRQLPIMIKPPRRLVITKETYDLAMGGLNQIAIKLVETNVPGVYQGHEMGDIEIQRILGTEKRLTIWGGLIEEILHLEGGKQKLETDPRFKTLYRKLQCLEQVRSFEELEQALLILSFSERERNYLHSPLLDHLYQLRLHDKSKFLTLAAAHGHIDAMRFLLERGAIIDNNALPFASENGHLNVVELLLEHGAHVSGSSLSGASKMGHTAIVQLLLKHGADVNDRDNRALQLASVAGHVEVVRLLLDHGANVHADDDSALRLASTNGNTDVVWLLLQRGADIHAENDSALVEAALNNHVETTKLLLEHGAIYDEELISEARKSGYAKIVELLSQRR